jgi:hypothetical protein
MNLVHVLDQELYGNPFAGSDGQGLSDGSGDFSAELAAYESPFQIGDTVIHDIFGEGVVIGANKEYTTFEVQFKDGSVRSIRAPFLRLPDLPE